MRMPGTHRRSLLLLLPLLAGCGAIGTPYVEPRRFPLEPVRNAAPRPPSGRAMLIRTMRAGPGLETRSLRRIRADGTLDLAFYEGWLAPPADLAEQALRNWLTASGLFSALTAPGSRLNTPLILETELTALEARLAEGRGRANLSVLLLAQPDGQDARPLAQFLAEGFAPMAASPNAGQQAAAMVAALAAAFAEVEARVAAALGQAARGAGTDRARGR